MWLRPHCLCPPETFGIWADFSVCHSLVYQKQATQIKSCTAWLKTSSSFPSPLKKGQSLSNFRLPGSYSVLSLPGHPLLVSFLVSITHLTCSIPSIPSAMLLLEFHSPGRKLQPLSLKISHLEEFLQTSTWLSLLPPSVLTQTAPFQ